MIQLSGRITTAVLMAVLATQPAAGQTEQVVSPGGLQMTRAQLEEQARAAEQLAVTGGERTRQQAMTQAALLRQRLAEGDLQVGDRIALYVAGYPQMSDTFTVAMGRVLVLPEAGEIPLHGVLRSELQAHLTTQIGRVLREPTVRVQPLIRLDIRGAVGRPGYYTMAADMLLSDVIMAAGGPAPGAGLDNLKIIRGTSTLWSGDQTRSAMIEGLTLDQLNVRAGDRIDVPTRRTPATTMRAILGIGSGIASAIYLIHLIRR
jgi:protein involved in polysaccharide export with SLBB domain